jgi:predicted protein tyrosine phosphatase
MKILIMSRCAIEKMAEHAFPDNTAVISIADFGDEFATLKNAPAYVHRIAFDDVDNDVIVDELGTRGTEAEITAVEKKYHMFSREQAVAIAEFYASIGDKAELLICQCEHGQSRSAAVASAILEYRARHGIDIFADDRYYPNNVVFRRVLSALCALAPLA